MELRVCKHCLAGEHGNTAKTEVSKDMVECAETVREYKDLIGLDAIYITKVGEGDSGAAQSLPAVVASVDNNQIQLSDTQLVMEDDDGNMLVYPEPQDILEVLTRNIEQINTHTSNDVTVELSEEALDLGVGA